MEPDSASHPEVLAGVQKAREVILSYLDGNIDHGTEIAAGVITEASTLVVFGFQTYTLAFLRIVLDHIKEVDPDARDKVLLAFLDPEHGP